MDIRKRNNLRRGYKNRYYRHNRHGVRKRRHHRRFRNGTARKRYNTAKKNAAAHKKFRRNNRRSNRKSNTISFSRNNTFKNDQMNLNAKNDSWSNYTNDQDQNSGSRMYNDSTRNHYDRAMKDQANSGYQQRRFQNNQRARRGNKWLRDDRKRMHHYDARRHSDMAAKRGKAGSITKAERNGNFKKFNGSRGGVAARDNSSINNAESMYGGVDYDNGFPSYLDRNQY